MAYNVKEIVANKPSRFTEGHRMCAGCGAPVVARHILRALKEEDHAVISTATGCMEVSTFIYPYTAWTDSFIHTAFECAAANAAGAEAAIIPEDTTGSDQLIEFMERGIRKSKKSCIVIVSESPKCGAMYYAERVNKEYPNFDVRVSILGHLQRGGSPSARDRILASQVGVGAIEALVQGQRNVMVGVRNNEVVYVPFVDAVGKRKIMDKKLIKVLDELSI